ncbi:hypothetical protein MLD38_038187 [Melastoma candidum]|uniref:Uncharacterized protein n=1 Tax=Melastoma candidum TaxID=119954 RepID=A0ACB9KYD5_9MYRT|nr:hypothetical protein MLD38_038187 [Melastoma candidum]
MLARPNNLPHPHLRHILELSSSDRSLVSLPYPQPHRPQTPTELANQSQETPQKETLSAPSPGGKEGAVGVVRALYEALCSRDVDTVHRLLAPDLEWWFHGPPSHQHLMRLLTGSHGRRQQPQQQQPPFAFVPDTITSFEGLVIAEGHERCSVFWVHAWTVSDEGVITQVREYFNTSLTVTRFGGTEASSSEITTVPSTDALCASIWESSLSDQVGKSVPGLVLAL